MTAVKFNIEIANVDGASTEILHQASVDEINPLRARQKAGALLNLYSGRGANSARVLNHKDEELYSWKTK